jgi:hypothetical protein
LKPLEIYRTTKPYHINIPEGGIPGGSQTNEVSESSPDLTVRDIRGKECDLTLDKNGFQVAHDDGSVSSSLPYDDYGDAGKVASHARPAIERFLKTLLNAEHIITFAFRVSTGRTWEDLIEERQSNYV